MSTTPTMNDQPFQANRPDLVDDGEDRGRRMDPELLAMQRLLRIVEDLPASAQARVVAYLTSRYQEGKVG
jgi:hypothetical protein